MLNRSRRQMIGAIAFTIAVSTPTMAPAQPTDPAALAKAETIFKEAIALMAGQKYDLACPKLEQVTRLVPAGIGAKEELAKCFEKQGKLASAWAQLFEVEAQARQQGQTERSAEAARLATALKNRLSTLTIEVSDAVRKTPGLTITRDAAPVADALWGSALPADNGAHEIVVSAPGYKPFRKTVKLTGERIDIRIDVAPLVPDVVGADRRPWQLPTGVAALGLGAASLVAGAALGGVAIERNNESKQDGQCLPADLCSQTGYDLRNEARAFGDASTAAIIVGGVFLAGGVVLLATAPGNAKAADRTDSGQGSTTPKRPKPAPSSDDVYKSPIQVRLFGFGISVKGTW